MPAEKYFPTFSARNAPNCANTSEVAKRESFWLKILSICFYLRPKYH
jgi:hypothetical protein